MATQRIAENPAYGAPIDPKSRQPSAVVDLMEEHEPALTDEPLLDFLDIFGWVIASFARATTSCALASPISPRSRLNTSSNETKVSTSIRMPWNGVLATLAFADMFSP